MSIRPAALPYFMLQSSHQLAPVRAEVAGHLQQRPSVRRRRWQRTGRERCGAAVLAKRRPPLAPVGLPRGGLGTLGVQPGVRGGLGVGPA